MAYSHARYWFCVAVILPACVVRAQLLQFDLTLSWSEVVAGTNVPVASPNGFLEPGEGARIGLTVSFSPPVGTPVPYQQPAPGGVAPNAGFWGVGFSTLATSALGGSWSSGTTSSGFNGSFLLPQPDGSLVICGVRQTPAIGSYPIASNPLPSLWQAVWTPSTYQPRQAGFHLEPITDSDPAVFVYLGLDPGGNPLFGHAFGGTTYVPVQIPIVPAPSTGAALLWFLAAASTRRSRR